MRQTAISVDGIPISFETQGSGKAAILFVHGWLGSARWWDQQRDEFASKYQVVQIDLAGHGKSPQRKSPSVRAYAEDIKAVVEKLGLSRIILVGHSMSGSHVVEAYHLIPNKILGIILVDTLLNLDQMPSLKEAAPFFDGMRRDFKGTIAVGFAQYVFAKSSPKAVVERIVQEVSGAEPAAAILNLEPYYTTDVRKACTDIQVPVRAINSDLYPTDVNANRKYFSDFDYELISGVGHYPMLEAPEEFNSALGRALTAIETSS